VSVGGFFFFFLNAQLTKSKKKISFRNRVAALGPFQCEGMYLIRETKRVAGGLVVSMFSGNRFFHYQFNRVPQTNTYTNPQGKNLGTVEDLVAYYKV
jgi:hypothetical protein